MSITLPSSRRIAWISSNPLPKPWLRQSGRGICHIAGSDPMKTPIEQRVLTVKNYMVSHNAAVRATAEWYGGRKSTIRWESKNNHNMMGSTISCKIPPDGMFFLCALWTGFRPGMFLLLCNTSLTNRRSSAQNHGNTACPGQSFDVSFWYKNV